MPERVQETRDGGSRTPRERIVYAAAQSLRRRGAAASGLRGMVAEAEAPWGSLHHYFPRGKDQVVAEALAWSGDLAGARVRTYLATSRRPSPRGLFDDLVETWVVDLERTGFERGCPVLGAVADGVEPGGEVHAAVLGALESWRHPIVVGLVEMGLPRPRARDLATLMLAALEGGIAMARATGSTEPLRAIRLGMRPVLAPAAGT